MAKVIINNGDTGLVARTGINSNFTELYNYDAAIDSCIGKLDASLRNVISLSIALTPDTSMSTQIRFDKINGYVYGTRLAPIQYNFTMSASSAIVGVTNLIISASTGTPTFPITFKKISGTYLNSNPAILDSSRNYIYVTYIDASVQLYSINNIIG
jgi:hypothetical protein